VAVERSVYFSLELIATAFVCEGAFNTLRFGIKLLSAVLCSAYNASLICPLFIYFHNYQGFWLPHIMLLSSFASWKWLTFLQIGNVIHVRISFLNGHQSYNQNKPESNRDMYVPNDIMSIRHWVTSRMMESLRINPGLISIVNPAEDHVKMNWSYWRYAQLNIDNLCLLQTHPADAFVVSSVMTEAQLKSV
jgi:hypothetical protein